MSNTVSGLHFLNPKIRFEKHKYILLEDNILKGVKLKPSWKNLGCQLSGVVGHVHLFYFIYFFNEWRFDFSACCPVAAFQMLNMPDMPCRCLQLQLTTIWEVESGLRALRFINSSL